MDPEASVHINERDTLIFKTSRGPDLLREALENEMIRRILQACSVCSRCVSRTELPHALAELDDGSVTKLAVRSVQKDLKQELIDEIPGHVKLAQRDHTRVLSVDVVGQECFIGSAADAFEDHVNEPPRQVVSRAYHKMAESCRRWVDVGEAIRGNVLDVGASPGGWTQYCLERQCRVVAVDPAPLDASLTEVIHLKSRVEDVVIDDLKHLVQGSFDAVVCDANCHPNQACRALAPLLVPGLLKPGTVLLLTLKQPNLTQKNAADDPESCHDVMAFLTNLGFETIRIAWLWANSRRERTLAATWTPPPSSHIVEAS